MLLSSFSGSLLIKNSCCLSENGNILYVGGGGEGNYSNIQDAINDAEDGYTIYVYPGYYNERVVINKSISLIGIVENGEKPVIDGNGTETIWVAVNDTSVKNFVIKNVRGSAGPHRGILAARIYKLRNIHIENNTIFAAPPIVMSANYSTIANNTIIGRGDGILSSGFKNKIIFNNVSNCSKDKFSIAISVAGRYNMVYKNIIHNNSIGISCYGKYNNISYNIIYKNSVGIEIWEVFSPSSYNEIHDNFIYKCEKGIELSASYNRIFKNNISSCDTGIEISGGSYNVVENNTIYENGNGIMFTTWAEISPPVFGNIFRYNRLDGNFKRYSTAVLIFADSFNNTFMKNDIVRMYREWEDIQHEKVIVEIDFNPLKMTIYKDYYAGNYWDTWHYQLPKPIDAKWITRMFGRDILKINGYIFDWHPSLQPNCS